jgi:hypothetical protein
LDRENTDAMRLRLDFKHFGEPDERALAADVGGHIRNRPRPSSAGDIDDAPPAPRDHAGKDSVARQQRSANIHFEGSPPRFRASFPGGTEWSSGAGVVNQHIHGPERSYYFLMHRVYGGWLGYVGRDRHAEAARFPYHPHRLGHLVGRP